MVRATPDNRYGPTTWIVDASAAKGSHTTIASAIADSSAGDTIYVHSGTYTENITTKAGVRIMSDLTGMQGPAAIIAGTVTMTEGGVHSLAGLQISSNGAVCIDVTGSNTIQSEVVNCRINMTNGDGVAINNANAGINFVNCRFDQTGNNLDYFNLTSCSFVKFMYCDFLASAATKGTSTIASGEVQLRWCAIQGHQFTTSSSGVIEFWDSYSDQEGNIVFLTTAGTGTSAIFGCYIESGTSAAISVGAGTTVNLRDSCIKSSNAAPVAGAGTINYVNVSFAGTTSEITTTTQSAGYTQLGKWRALGQPAFLATGSNVNDVTGDATAYTLTFTTEVFDQNSNFDGTSTFTAPITGRYELNCFVSTQQIGAGHTTGTLALVTSNRTYTQFTGNPANMATAGGAWRGGFSVLADMDAADTATVVVTISGSTKTVDTQSSPASTFSGALIA